MTEMNRTEKALLLAMAVATMQNAGTLAKASGYPQPTSEEFAAIRDMADRVLTETVIGLRDQGPTPMPGEIAQVCREVAEAAILNVLGAPPAAKANAN